MVLVLRCGVRVVSLSVWCQLRRRIFTITDDGILMQPDPKYLAKMMKLLGLVKPRSRKVPCAPEICSPDITPALDIKPHAVFRACVGGLLYLSPDRCDIQLTESMLARKVQSPSERLPRVEAFG